MSYAWDGDALLVTAPALIGPKSISYPYGPLVTIDRDNLIKDACGTPLRTFGQAFQ